ncbi:MAG: helix-turn-helix transcriptional regulator [Roseburia sp.]|nr:helix-turn-helix transcriptional regulator [Roseburia sp.]
METERKFSAGVKGKEKALEKRRQKQEKLGKPEQKHRRRRTTYKRTIYRWVSLLVVTLVLLFGLYSLFNYRTECMGNAQNEADNTVSRIVSQVDERLENLTQYYVSIVTDDSIQWMLDNTVRYSDYSKYKSAYDDMSCKGIFRDYVSGFALVNFRTGWVLSNKGLFEVDDATNYGGVLELYEEDTFHKNYWNYEESIVLEGVQTVYNKDYRVTMDINGLSYVMRLPATSYNTYALLVANVNMNTWQNWIREWLSAYEEVVVLDESGGLIYATDAGLAPQCEAAWAALEIPYSGALGRQKANGHTYMSSVRVSDVLGWHYYVFHDVRDFRTGEGFLFGLIMCLLLFAVFGFLTVSHFIYQPIGELVKSFSGSDEGHPIDSYGGNELDYLEGSLRNMKEDKLALEGLLGQQQEKISELFELRLMRGEVDSDEWQEYLEGLRLRPWKYFATVVVILSIRSEEAGDMINEDAICLQMLQEMPEPLKAMAWMPPVYNAGTIFAIFAEEDENTLLETMKAFYRGMQTCARNAGGFHVMMGVSATHTKYNHIRAAYRESINALTFKTAVDGYEGEAQGQEPADCHFYLASSTSRSSVYNHSYEEDIKAAMKAVDKQKCYQVTDDFCRWLCELKGHENEMSVYLLRYVNSILLAAVDTGIDFHKVYPDGIRKIYIELLEVLEPDRERRYIKWKFIDPIIKERLDYLENHSETMLSEIEGMIAERNGNLSLPECAEALGVHPTYIWKLLKMERNRSFSDYVEEYKLSEAKRLLMETDLTVAEIAEKLNYTNAQNFIRFFNKSTGVTPGKFRKLY